MDVAKHLIFKGVSALAATVMPLPSDEALAAHLEGASIPITSDPCRSCPNPCNGGDGQDGYSHEEWPTRYFDADTGSNMLGMVWPYYRQVVISTGKSDWDWEVTKSSGSSFASYLADVHSQLAPSANNKMSKTKGLIEPKTSNKLMIHNGSDRGAGGETERLLLFPDYILVEGVQRSLGGAEVLWKSLLNPCLGRAGEKSVADGIRRYALPFNAVLLVCSHKRRDNRCAISAPIIKRGLTDALEAIGWEVSDQVGDSDDFDMPTIDEVAGSGEGIEAKAVDQLKGIADRNDKRALIQYVSHFGGHQYAGNVVIYFPNGVGIWYGRVSSHEVGAVVKTITEGKIYPALLRAGVNITRPHGQTLMDW